MKVFSKTRMEIHKDCLEWAKEINEDFTPDLIIFIAKSGYLFAKPMADYFHCELIELIAIRPASKFKDRLKPIIKMLPQKIILSILSSPYMYKFNEKNSKRIIEPSVHYQSAKNNTYKNILLVDDSTDTGWTLKAAFELVKKDFPKATVKLASYSVIKNSKQRINVNYWRFEDAVILTATSRKSAEYSKFLEDYNLWRREDNK